MHYTREVIANCRNASRTFSGCVRKSARRNGMEWQFDRPIGTKGTNYSFVLISRSGFSNATLRGCDRNISPLFRYFLVARLYSILLRSWPLPIVDSCLRRCTVRYRCVEFVIVIPNMASEKKSAKASSKKEKSAEEILSEFQTLRNEQRILANKLSEMEMELNEHKYEST